MTFIGLGIKIPVSWAFVLIIIVSLIVNQIDPKLTCLAYVMAIIYVIDEGLVLAGIKREYFRLSYVEMIYLVGLLHGIEGMLTILFGGKQSCAVITYRGEAAAGGYQAYDRWLIPMLLFSVEGIYIPLVAAVIYLNESFVLEPKSKAKVMGSLILIYGILVIIIGYLTARGYLPLLLSMVAMPVLHEVLFTIDAHIEKGRPLYPCPKQGIRVMTYEERQVRKEESKKGLEKGDIILAINEISVNSEEEYLMALEAGNNKLLIEKLSGEKVEVYDTYEELLAMKIVFLPPL